MLLITCFGGAVRKWVTTSGAVSNAILGVQMLLPFVIYFFKSDNHNSPFQKHGILSIYFFYLVVHVFHPFQLTLWHGFFGILIHGGFWLGIFYYLSNRHLFEPQRLLTLMLLAAAIEIFLAFIQYQLPSTHFLNKYAREGISIAQVGDKVRVTGTFSYLSGYTAYLLFYCLFVWALAKMRYPQWFVLLATAFGFIAALMTGSRSIAFLFFVLVIPMVLTEYPIKDIFKVVGRLIMPAMIVTAIILLYREIPVADIVEQAYDNFMMRVETNRRSGEEQGRIFMDLWYIQHGNYKYPLFGVGSGSTYQGAIQLFGKSPKVIEFGYVENELPRVLLEGGWILLLLKLFMGLIMALNLSFKGFMRWSVWFVVAFGQPIVYNPHNAAFLLLGIILVDNIVWRQQQEKNRRAREARATVMPANQLAPESLSPLAAVNNDRHFNGHPERSEGSPQ